MNIGTSNTISTQEECAHVSRVEVVTSTVERHICDLCNHVSFAFSDNELSDVDRGRFARSIDQLHSNRKT